MTPRTHDVDCLIVGAGVAGLWLRANLSAAGYSTLTIERSRAGEGQTIASQGILHRGLKYQLSPAAAKAAAELQAAQKDWDDALEGRGPVDLRTVKLLASSMHMWAPPGGVTGVLAKVTAGMASLTISSAARGLPPAERPEAFARAHPDTAVYEVQERCVDVASLIYSLLRAAETPVVLAHPVALRDAGGHVECALSTGDSVRAGCVVATAGEGNAAIASLIGLNPTSCMQRRPLRMVAMRGAPFELNGHCIQPMSDKPRITVTTTRGRGTLYWWLGGVLAEEGVARDDSAQIGAARASLAECVPWADISRASFATFPIDRAEGRTAEGRRPDGPVVRAAGRVMLAWPTKLALAPTLARDVLARIAALGVAPRGAAPGEIAVLPALSPWLAENVIWK